MTATQHIAEIEGKRMADYVDGRCWKSVIMRTFALKHVAAGKREIIYLSGGQERSLSYMA